MAVVVGNEEKGLAPLVRRRCDAVVAIPQYGTLPSLNVGVAGAVACFEVARQPGPAKRVSPMDVLFAGVATADFAAAVPWYERLMGRPADVIAHEFEVMWRITDGGWLYLVLDPPRAGQALVAFAVPDLERRWPTW